MIKNFKYLAMAAAVAALCSVASCVKNNGDDNTDDGSSNVPGVELVNEADKEISKVAVGLTDYEVMLAFSGGLTKEDVALMVPKEASEWCTASFSNEKDAILLSTDFNSLFYDDCNMTVDLNTTISIVDIEDDTKVYLTFTVKSIAGYIRVTSNPAYETDEYGMGKMDVSTEKRTVTFTVETNLEKWYAYSFDLDTYDSASWIEFSQPSGRGGETCTMTIKANDGAERKSYVSFDRQMPEYPTGSRYFMIVLTQEGAAEAK